MLKKWLAKNNFINVRYAMMISFSVLFAVCLIILSALILDRSSEALANKVTALTQDLTKQTCLNMNTYLKNIKDKEQYIFDEKHFYGFTNTIEDEDAKIETKKNIADRLHQVNLLGEYEDLAVMYSNNTYAGFIIERSLNSMGINSYGTLQKHLGSQSSAWISGLGGDFTKIFYIRRVNNNAIFIASRNIKSLRQVLQSAGENINLSFRLVDSNDKVIYSIASEEIGTGISADEKRFLDTLQGSYAEMTATNLIVVEPLENGWRLIADTSTSEVLQERNELYRFIIIMVAVAVLFVSAAGVFISVIISAPMEIYVADLKYQLSIDPTTKLANRKTFMNEFGKILSKIQQDRYLLIFMDIDNFTKINDAKGRVYGDRVLHRSVEVLRQEFSENGLVGRIHGDEFGIVVSIPNDIKDEKAYAKKVCEDFLAIFRKHFEDDELITATLGAVLTPACGKDLRLLLEMCDRAVIVAKRAGKNTYHIYAPSEDYNIWR